MMSATRSIITSKISIIGSKIVITGDVTQIDLPDDKVSGLKDAVKVLEDVKDIAICKLTSADVVRHALVQQIINAYEKAEKAGYCSSDDKMKFEATYQAYHSLGKNGVMDVKREKLLQMPETKIRKKNSQIAKVPDNKGE